MGPRPLPIRETPMSQNREQVRPQENRSMCQSREPSNYLAFSKKMKRSNQLLALVGKAEGWLPPAQLPHESEPPQTGRGAFSGQWRGKLNSIPLSEPHTFLTCAERRLGNRIMALATGSARTHPAPGSLWGRSWEGEREDRRTSRGSRRLTFPPPYLSAAQVGWKCCGEKELPKGVS